MKIENIQAFNTGREYSEHGQRIAWGIAGEGIVAFADIDRNICGTLALAPIEVFGDVLPITRREVLAGYDATRYEHLSWEDARPLRVAAGKL
jgi:hypothetical protein